MRCTQLKVYLINYSIDSIAPTQNMHEENIKQREKKYLRSPSPDITLLMSIDHAKNDLQLLKA